MAGPLDGIRVVDMTTTVLGPVTTQLLGDMGADVIKIEPPEGDAVRYLGPRRHENMAAMFLSNNRNKRSVVLNVKQPEAHEALYRLIETADVFVHNMRPKAATKLKIDYADVAKINPTIVYASASGYKRNGPDRDKPAFDDVIQGASGIPHLFMKSGREPQFAPFAAADKIAGYVLASAIGMALFHRERSGQGQEVYVPMLDTLVSFHLHEHSWGGVFEPPIGSWGYSRMATPDRRPLPTVDGHICVLCVTDIQWRRLLVAIGIAELADDERFATIDRRGENFDALYAAVAKALLARTTEEWMTILTAADVPCGPINKLDELYKEDYFVNGNFFEVREHPTEGKLRTSAIPVEFSATPCSVTRLAPGLGADTHDILTELGYDETDIQRIKGH